MHRLFVEKNPEFASESLHLIADLRANLAIESITGARIVQRYDLDELSADEFAQASQLILSEPQVESSSSELSIEKGEHAFAIEYLPGQFDQRADSAAQCVQILTGKDRPFVSSARVIILKGDLSKKDLGRIKTYLINPVDSHEIPVNDPAVRQASPTPENVAVLHGFNDRPESKLDAFRAELGLAMSSADIAHTQNYFRSEGREPTITELRMLDTYWSDHCRHTTFMSAIDKVEFDPGAETIQEAYQTYLRTRNTVYGEDTDRPVTLMDIALVAMKDLRKSGELDNLEISNEINAASIVVMGDDDQEWLVQFKNETHNHPTEIEPFGGAATCLGGCIRDPLSGRSYVYQAMRVSGAADPRTPYADTIPGKLPQRKICQEAAHGYSSYGNQIGLATGKVSEVYHPNYAAKRMEIGAVVSASPRKNVFRGGPDNGDFILLIGGRTGRDGVGGATGSSKEHTDTALENSAEVQKGDAPTERKIQRLFRNPELAPKIKICNDFGAGGVSVAIGEIADSLILDLDKVPKKYDGLDGTELAISESQERMAICVDPSDVDYFIAESDKENLECVHVATVTDSGRLIMTWRGDTIVDLSREFIETNGVQQSAQVMVSAPGDDSPLDHAIPAVAAEEELEDKFRAALSDLNSASQKGLGERFDSSVGAGTVLAPFGGTHQRTPVDAMVATLPFLEGHSTTTTHMAWGFNPYLASWSPYHGALYAVTESACRIVASGAKLPDIRLTLQEYFPKLGGDPRRWGLPFSALLGAFRAQNELRLAAIGGKDSMSGSFNDMDVPPTLVSFAVAPGSTNSVVSPEFKKVGSTVSLIKIPRDAELIPDFAFLKETSARLHEEISKGSIHAIHSLDHGGIATGLAKMAFGNGIGFHTTASVDLFRERFICFLVESDGPLPDALAAKVIGKTQEEPQFDFGEVTLPLDELLDTWTAPLDDVFPEASDPSSSEVETFSSSLKFQISGLKSQISKPKVVIPAFPGTNSEYDTAKAFTLAGATAETPVFRNLTPQAVEQSITALAEKISQSQILAIPGGFSAGDEPAGSGKFIATILRSPRVGDAVMDLLKNRDGLILGICNGFQALVKTGLVPYGEIRDPKDGAPTLTYNDIGRHIARYATTRISSNLSPWLAGCQVGDLHNVPFSHGEGKFYATEEDIRALSEAGQIATQYTDLSGEASMDPEFNPNGSVYAIEGISSPCGRVLGKMGHTERRGPAVGKNISGNLHQPLFKAGVDYFG
ncbi:phosphoribosylformylglycinamidine synthase [bacterium]|nr:phosphoribosylformylglycinamidine synthase [bacterium]